MEDVGGVLSWVGDPRRRRDEGAGRRPSTRGRGRGGGRAGTAGERGGGDAGQGIEGGRALGSGSDPGSSAGGWRRAGRGRGAQECGTRAGAQGAVRRAKPGRDSEPGRGGGA